MDFSRASGMLITRSTQTIRIYHVNNDNNKTDKNASFIFWVKGTTPTTTDNTSWSRRIPRYSSKRFTYNTAQHKYVFDNVSIEQKVKTFFQYHLFDLPVIVEE